MPPDSGASIETIGPSRSWLGRPQVLVLAPGPRHLDLIEDLMQAARASGQLTTDVHLAALTIEHQAELCTDDVTSRGSRACAGAAPFADRARTSPRPTQT